ncbi:MAG: SIR2 family protein [Nitrospirales bacterium]
MGNTDIPKHLVDEVREGRVVLVLGAGASMGAKRGNGKTFPSTEALARLLSDQFLDKSPINDNLAWISELAISTSCLSTVQDLIADQFSDPQPAKHHFLLPSFRWRGIATTNYDRIVECSYEKAPNKIQQVVPFLSDEDKVDAKLRDPSCVGLLKLHGCVTRTHDESLPLILTVDQYVTHRKNRKRVFQMLEEWASENTLVFIGHSLQDVDLRKILVDLVGQLGSHPRFYMVRPGVDDRERDFWAKKNITVIGIAYDEFLQKLDGAIPPQLRPLLKRLEVDHPIRKHFTTQTPPSRTLIESLEYDWEYVHAGMVIEHGSPKQFYSGFSLGWYPIQAELDVRRRLSSKLIDDVVLRSEEDRPTIVELYLVKAEAGAGKSVTLRRTAWDAAIHGGALVLYIRSERLPEAGVVEEVATSTGQRIFVFIENPATNLVGLARLLTELRKRKIRVTFITAERVNEWNVRCQELENHLSGEHILHSLDESEIGALVNLLEKHHALGVRLERLSRDERIEEFVKQAGRQLLVALHVATQGKPFEDILLDEYRRILPPEAQRLYLTVCVLNRLKVPVRAGVISRVHDIPFEDFKQRLFKPLEHVVHSVLLPWGDMAYRARHAEIAEIVFRRVLIEPSDRYHEIVRILGALNPMYSTDSLALRGLLRARQVDDLFPSNEDAVELYKTAVEVMGENDVYLLHQRANYERIRPNGNLQTATSLLQKARHLDPRDETVIHTLAEVMRNRADNSTELLERKRYRNEAKALLQRISLEGPSAKFAISTRAKISIDSVADILREATSTERDIDEAVREAEKEIQGARQRYPGDPHIGGLEANLGRVLGDDHRTYNALEKARQANPRDPFIASRLATILINRQQIEKAKIVVSEALRSNRGDKRLNHLFAEIERQYTSKPDVSELVNHYRRAFTRWDTNYESQFWFARYAWELGTNESKAESKEVFRHLREAPMPHSGRIEIRDIMKNAGHSLDFFGTVTRVESTHGFIRLDNSGDWVFFHQNDVLENYWGNLAGERRVRFHLGFSLGGLRAFNVRLEG